MRCRAALGSFGVTVVLLAFALPASAQSFKVQCPSSTPTHPLVDANGATGQPGSTLPNPAIKCQQVAGGDGFSTMGDGHQLYMFSFGPLSGLADIASGNPGTEPNVVFNRWNNPAGTTVTDPKTNATTTIPYDPTIKPGAPVAKQAAEPGITPAVVTTYNGAVGIVPDPELLTDPVTGNPTGTPAIDGHVDPRQIIDVGVMNGSIPAPLMAIDEDDEFFLTLSNVGMIMRPDLFEQHTIHFHGYPNASSFYDGVPDASVAINIGGSFTYYYLAPDAGTYFWHCHIAPPEHLQMGMVGQLYVRPRQNRLPVGAPLAAALTNGYTPARSKCGPDLLCSVPVPTATGATHATNKSSQPTLYAYNDGDGTTAYDVEYPIQIHGFDPNFHFVGMTFNPETFADMKDKYFLLNGRSYPDTVTEGPLATNASDGTPHFSQPLPAVINVPVGGRALLRISDLDVSEYQTLASIGIPMHVIGYNARLLRDLAGVNTDYYTNSVTLAGGESLDLILDASDTSTYQAGQVYYLYTPNLDHLANDAENFGGLMTEVHICNAVDPTAKRCM